MDHSYYQDRISAYADNELPLDERQVLDEHLAECEACRALLDRINRLNEFVDSNLELGDDDFLEQSATRIDRAIGLEEETPVTEITGSRWHGLGWKIAAAAASVAILVFVGLNTDEIRRMVLEEQVDSPRPEAVQPSTDARQYRAETGDDSETGTAIGAAREQEPADVTEAHRRDTDDGGKGSGGREELAEMPAAVPTPVPTEGAPAVKKEQAPSLATEDKSPAVEQTEVEPPSSPKSKEARRTLSLTEKDQPEDEVQSTDELTEDLSELVPDVTGEVVMAPADSVDQIGFWRAKRDAANTLHVWLRPKDSDTRGLKFDAAAESQSLTETKPADRHAAEAAGKARLRKEDYDFGDVSRELVTAYYHIARLAEDDHERQQSIRFLRTYIGDKDAPAADLARALLDSLNIGQNGPGLD